MLFSANAILPKKKKVPEVENPSKKKKKKECEKLQTNYMPTIAMENLN